MMIYHRDRLIKCFLHVGYQLSPDSRGVGVIGVVRALRLPCQTCACLSSHDFFFCAFS
jgi:hypothetical protein